MKRKFVKLGNIKNLGVENIPNFLNNYGLLNNLVNKAKTGNFFIEAISLQLQIMDFWLKILITNLAGNKYGITSKDTFGRVLHKARNLLPGTLYGKLSDFNVKRTLAIHRFIYGLIDYRKIGEIVSDFESLPSELQKYTISKIEAELGTVSELPHPTENEHLFSVEK